jgi:hypothetical protein
MASTLPLFPKDSEIAEALYGSDKEAAKAFLTRIPQNASRELFKFRGEVSIRFPQRRNLFCASGTTRKISRMFRKSPLPRVQRPGFVYVMRAEGLYNGTSRLKIGCSITPKSRLRDLASSSPIPLELVAAYESANPYADEARAHDILAAYRSHGEWFTLEVQTAAFVVAGGGYGPC